MPNVVIVEYRSIDANVNGDKVASGYKKLACIPNGDAADRVALYEAVDHYENTGRWYGAVQYYVNPVSDQLALTQSNLDTDNSVSSVAKRLICDRYGRTYAANNL